MKPIFGYEHIRKPLASVKQFYQRLLTNAVLAFGIILVSLGIGVWGYISLAHLKFADALLNASMILGGMGPVDIMTTDSSKYFASFYALFSGVVFLSTVAVLFAPVLHRAMHKFHLESESDEEKKDRKN
jgi:flagellar biosynthesis protein FliR